MRIRVVIRTPWGDLSGVLDEGAGEKVLAFSMAAGMLGKGKLVEWVEVPDAEPSPPENWRRCALCGHPDFSHHADPDVVAGEAGQACVAPDCTCEGLLVVDQ
jgi:hypothetical protein